MSLSIRRYIPTVLVMCTLAWAPLASAQTVNTPPPDEESPEAEDTESADSAVPSGQATVAPPGCSLTAQEELLLSEYRLTLQRLEQRRLLVEAREQALLALQRQVRTDMDRLREMQGQLIQQMDDQERQREADRRTRITQLARLLRGMRAAEAARILSEQPNEIAVPTLEALGDRIGGKVLAAMPTERAALLAETLIAQPVPVTTEEEAQP
jgi:flagellar motility protein MotE (MotC chaperone)